MSRSRWTLESETQSHEPYRRPVFLQAWWWRLRRYRAARFVLANDHVIVRYAAAMAVVTAAALLLVHAANQPSTSTTWGSNTAAWVQGVGSIVAILAAIWIDQGEASRSRRERRRELQTAEDNRTGAISDAADALYEAANAIRTLPYDGFTSLGLPDDCVQALESADFALRYYLALPVELDLRLLKALKRTQHIMQSTRSDLGGEWSVVAGDNTWPTLMKTFADAGQQVFSVLQGIGVSVEAV